MEKVDHIGIAVKDIKKSTEMYERLLGVAPVKEEVVESQQVHVVFFKKGETKIELLEGLDPEGAIQKFISKRGEGIHHVAYSTSDIRREMERLKSEGFKLIDSEPRNGADNKLVCFLHPASCGGVLTELCQPR